VADALGELHIEEVDPDAVRLHPHRTATVRVPQWSFCITAMLTVDRVALPTPPLKLVAEPSVPFFVTGLDQPDPLMVTFVGAK